jgi:TP901 family phage tail tape measure protein
MARSFNVSYRFSAKNSFSAVSKKIKADNKRLGDSFKRLRARVKKTNREFKLASPAAKGLISNLKGLAVAAAAFLGLKALITRGAEFETALADLSAITGATGKDLDKLKAKTLSMARASVTSQKDVAEGIKLVASAKPDLLKNIDALAETTKQVLLLKNAAGIELADAANITAQGLNIFGKGADQAARFVNVLAAGAKLGSSEIAETGEAMLIAGPAARAAGLSFEQLNAAIQTVAKGGIKASRSGTALNAIFGRLQRAGIDFQELGLQGSFEVIKKKMDSLKSSTERAQFAAKIFGEEHSKVGFALMDNVSFLGQYEKSLAGTNIAQEQANIKLGTFSKGATKAGIILDEKLIGVFDKARFGINSVSTALFDFVEGLDAADIETFGIILSSFGVIATAAAKIITVAFKGIMLVLKPVFAVLKGIGTAIGQIVAGIATMDFSKFNLKGAFDIGGKFLGIFGGDKPEVPTTQIAVTPTPVGTPVGTNSKSTTDINVNMNAPKGVVQSVQSRTRGTRVGNVGVNMAGG